MTLLEMLGIGIGAEPWYFSYHENKRNSALQHSKLRVRKQTAPGSPPSPLQYAPFRTASAQSPPSRTPRTSLTSPRSVRKGHRSVSSVSWGSLNHEETGTALLGWKIYDAGELSRMMVSAIGRPNCERSCRELEIHPQSLTIVRTLT